jgi:uncharacterized protein
MFLEQAQDGKNDVGRWLALLVIISVAITIIGTIPVQILVYLQTAASPDLIPNLENPLDLSVFDISAPIQLLFLIMPYLMGILALALLIKPIHERRAITLISGSIPFRWSHFFWGGKIWLLLVFIYTLIISSIDKHSINIDIDSISLLKTCLVMILLVPIKTGLEEILFRGYLMQGIHQFIRYKWLNLVITALIFAGSQVYLSENKDNEAILVFIQYLLFGILLSLCAILDDGLEMAWGVNSINTIFIGILSLSERNSDSIRLSQLHFSNKSYGIGALLIISALFMYSANKKFKWIGWSTLFARSEQVVKVSELDSDYLYDEYSEEDQA